MTMPALDTGARWKPAYIPCTKVFPSLLYYAFLGDVTVGTYYSL
jgi:hypothetical protein